jgi:hypothetical protein
MTDAIGTEVLEALERVLRFCGCWDGHLADAALLRAHLSDQSERDDPPYGEQLLRYALSIVRRKAAELRRVSAHHCCWRVELEALENRLRDYADRPSARESVTPERLRRTSPERAKALHMAERIADEYGRQAQVQLDPVVLVEAMGAAGVFRSPQSERESTDARPGESWTDEELLAMATERDVPLAELQTMRDWFDARRTWSDEDVPLINRALHVLEDRMTRAATGE